MKRNWLFAARSAVLTLGAAAAGVCFMLALETGHVVLATIDALIVFGAAAVNGFLASYFPEKPRQ